MKAPRYLLREATLVEMLKPLPKGDVLEIGYGSGEGLMMLASLGFNVCGYDVSVPAFETAREKIKTESDNKKITLLSPYLNWQELSGQYDLIVLMEVIGYWNDLERKLEDLKLRLKPGGRIAIGFTKQDGASTAIEATGKMRRFRRAEIEEILNQRLKFRIESFWNYGYPLANFLRPFLDLYYLLLMKKGKLQSSEDQRMKESGLGTSAHPLIAFASFFLNRFTLYPFILIQKIFRHSDLGNGYLVLAANE